MPDVNEFEVEVKLRSTSLYLQNVEEWTYFARAMSKLLEIFGTMFSLTYLKQLSFQIFNIQRILYYIGLMTISIYLPNMIQLQPDTKLDSTMIRYAYYK